MAEAPKKKRMSRLWKKFKDSFKDQGPIGSSSSTTRATTSTPTKPEPAPETSKPESVKPTKDSTPATTDADKRLEKARAIFKKYDFEFDEEEWNKVEPSRQVQRERVNKPIRMRVKYTCHNCKAQFGRTKTCTSCEHERCKDCTRYPPKKDKPKLTPTDPTEVDPEPGTVPATTS
ncbi:uncharacterized protein AB675_4530 [Cyphellophora attinorum]|uniref:Uncharacterized protein n=1 Tax=Cyphellophora attinorum TaxID=1664694 RepID=A0A0N1NXW3_9EURO|nr:uncharacterized protein AB675_4530 [Phialophora attinorum]KPI39140.1 hypothetical protein AB675_4530 [Phialophora attinorum]